MSAVFTGGGDVTMKALACALILTALFAGCARGRFAGMDRPVAAADSYDKVSCEQSGGKWNQFTRNCDR
jgi:hypothetical protein